MKPRWTLLMLALVAAPLVWQPAGAAAAKERADKQTRVERRETRMEKRTEARKARDDRETKAARESRRSREDGERKAVRESRRSDGDRERAARAESREGTEERDGVVVRRQDRDRDGRGDRPAGRSERQVVIKLRDRISNRPSASARIVVRERDRDGRRNWDRPWYRDRDRRWDRERDRRPSWLNIFGHGHWDRYRDRRPVHSLPHHHRIDVHGHRYFFSGGLFYEYGPLGYVLVRAPIGAHVPFLPDGYRTFVHGGITFYLHLGTYFRFDPIMRVYVVVDPPVYDYDLQDVLYLRDGEIMVGHLLRTDSEMVDFLMDGEIYEIPLEDVESIEIAP